MTPMPEVKTISPTASTHLTAVGAEEAEDPPGEVAVGDPAGRLLVGGAVDPAVHGQEVPEGMWLTASLYPRAPEWGPGGGQRPADSGWEARD